MDPQNNGWPITTADSQASGRLKVDTWGMKKKKIQILHKKLKNY